jgi:hypothetical protein
MIPKLLSLHVDKNYLHRLTPLFGMATLSTTLPADTVRKMFVPVLLTLYKDQIANIRMNVAKTIHQILSHIKGQAPDVEVSALHTSADITRLIGQVQIDPEGVGSRPRCRREVLRSESLSGLLLIFI